MRRRNGGIPPGLFMFVLVIGVPIYLLMNFWWVIIPIGIIIVIAAIAVRMSSSPKRQIAQVYLEDVDAMDGVSFENYVADLLRLNGFSDVRLTKPTGDFGADITASRGGCKYVFQCKRYSRNCGPRPIQEVHASRSMHNAVSAVVITNSYFTENAVKLAKSTDVDLWDRDKLLDLISVAKS